jgi:hypothetical protein
MPTNQARRRHEAEDMVSSTDRTREIPESRLEMFLLSPAAPVQRRWFYISVAVLVLAAWLCSARSLPVFPVDDAYITLHNAQVLWWGDDPNFAGTPALAGATSAVHLGLVWLLMAFLKPLWALQAAMWLAIAAYVLGLSRLAFQHRASMPLAGLFVLVGLTAARIPHQLMNGLETGLAMAALTWVLVFATDADHPDSRALPILCGLLPFIRPEFAALSVILLVMRWHWRFQNRGTGRVVWRGCLEDAALMACAALPWLIWYSASTGTPYPTTISAKRAFFAESGFPALIKMPCAEHNLETFLLAIGFLSFAGVGLALTKVGRISLVFCLVLVGAYCSQFPDALAHYEQRYLYITVPFILYGLAVLIGHASKTARAVALALLLVGVVQSLWMFPSRWHYYEVARSFTSTELASVVNGCNGNLPKGSKLLVHDVGYISYATNFPMVDFVGLKTPLSASYHKRETLPSMGAKRVDVVSEIAIRERPDYLVMLKTWDGIFGVTSGLRARGWGLRLLNKTTAAYQVYQMTPPRKLQAPP